MFSKIGWDAGGRWRYVGSRTGFPCCRAGFGGEFDTTFDCTDGIKVFIEFELVIATQFAAKATGVFKDKIKQVLEVCGFGGLAGQAFSEESFVDKSWVDFLGDWSSWRLPGDMGTVKSGVSNVAVDATDDRFCAQFQRGEWCELAGVLSDELIDGDPATADILPGGFGDGHSGEEIRSLRVVAIATVAVFLVESGEDQCMLADFGEWLQSGAERVFRTGVFRNPGLFPDTVWEVNEGCS